MKNFLFVLTLLVSLVNYSQNTDEILDKINNQKNYQSAINDLNQLIKQDISEPYNYYLRAYSYKKLKNFFNAKKDYLKSFELGYVYSAAYADLASIYFQEEYYTNAAVYYKKQLEELGGDNLFAHFNIALSHYRSGQYKLAIEYFSNVISLNTDEETVANAYEMRGKSKNNLSDKSGCGDITKAVILHLDALLYEKSWGYDAPIDYIYNSYCTDKKMYKFYLKQWKKRAKRMRK